jgi:hypothetical protein
MARMFPEHLPADVESAAERRLYELFERSLPKDFTVFHGVRWLSGCRGRDPQDGEADFVVAHPRLGVLVLEVKGGTIGRDASTGIWCSRDQVGRDHQISDPFKQVTRSMHALVSKCRDTPSTAAHRYHFGHAVAFPDVSVESIHLGVDAPPETVLDAARFREPRGAVEAALRFWNRDQEGPGAQAVDALVRLLAPSYMLEMTLRTRIDQEEVVLRELTEQQFRVLHMLSAYRRALIEGCAGSGKTMLALEKAKRLSEEGFQTLFVCFNRALAGWAKGSLGAGTAVDVHTFHELCSSKAKEAGIPVPDYRPGPAPPEFWEQTLPNALFEARGRLTTGYDAIIVDEGQDFRECWWVPLEAWLEDEKNGVLYIFKDDNQRIYGAGGSYPVESPPLRLSTNCRNTQKIHEVVISFWRGEMLPTCAGPPGTQVEVVGVSPEKAEAELRKLLYRLVAEERVLPGEITILTPRSSASSCWKEGRRLGNLSLTWQSPPPPASIFCASIPAFKGLESAVVILTELHTMRPDVRDEQLYVATSRARTHLVVLGELPLAEPEE